MKMYRTVLIVYKNIAIILKSTLKINKKTSTILRNYKSNNKPTLAFQIPPTERLSAVPYYNFRKAVNCTYLKKNGGNNGKVAENVRYVNGRNSIWVSLYLLIFSNRIWL